ncbi:hypothetical protein [Hyphomicrobium sp. DMF-1]|jgi:hypothetical protein|uniref:hypothetical protein n=1 Tax=Hyphomicrobium sp. DMF-1 TaxID=3019544 RepID=UPI0022EBC935|nr:hypothetical protein [Hyphomicrobium sp. DMF-1]WBT36625.1 hypothetical protein PE058_13275 [Hyphomicrobium sp. DMF-1]
MGLMDLWRSNPDSISAYMIRQIVAISGDGRLRDDSPCAAELRTYLREVSPDKLSVYASECLNDGFDDSGYVLQDVVNEIGRRLGFEVENGRYQGRQGGIGYDGIWRAEPDIALIVEVKTTDTYNVRLDAVAEYREKLRISGLVTSAASTLFVVGRKDTGALEAQIRGSRYAWDTRVVGVESLVKLMQIAVKSNERSTIRQIRELLRPFEYTRVDRIVDVMFDAATDVELAKEEEVAEDADHSASTDFPSKTPSDDLERMRVRIMSAVSNWLGTPLVQRRRVFFESADGEARACVAVSKRYERGYQPYWYAYHTAWSEFLSGATSGYFVLGCMDRNDAFALPVSVIDSFLPKLNQTMRRDGRSYWHVVLTSLDDGSLALYSSRTGEAMPLSSYSVPLGP